MKIPVLIRKPLEKPARLAIGMREYFYDYLQFASASSAVSRDWTAKRLGASIIKEYHRLEKGLALPEPLPGFGRLAIEKLFEQVALYEARFSAAPPTREARSVLEQYRASVWCQPDMAEAIDRFLGGSQDDALPAAGAITIDRDKDRTASAIDFAAFAGSRYSVRDFTGEAVPQDAVRDAVAISMKSPRVCNRGTTRCHAAFDPDIRARALSLQRGNAGFGHLAGAILVITSSRTGFTDFGERNQCWVDGGMFAMSLCYALHAAGFGTCMLNWSVLAKRDRALHRELDIPSDEAVITMMAVGVLKPAYRVAVSPREPLEQVFQILDRRSPFSARP